MRILAPVDGLEGTTRIAEEIVRIFDSDDAEVEFIHVNDKSADNLDTDAFESAVDICESEGFEVSFEVVPPVRKSKRHREQAGETVVSMADGNDYDHVVMHRHRSSSLHKWLFGSATETVLDAHETTVTLVP